jgi:hypothetical protein
MKTIGELKKLLNRFDDSMPYLVAGCDGCYSKVDQVIVQDGVIYLERNDDHFDGVTKYPQRDMDHGGPEHE